MVEVDVERALDPASDVVISGGAPDPAGTMGEVETVGDGACLCTLTGDTPTGCELAADRNEPTLLLDDIDEPAAVPPGRPAVADGGGTARAADGGAGPLEAAADEVGAP